MHESAKDDYFYVIEGEMLAEFGERRIVTETNHWLTTSGFIGDLSAFSCRALTSAQVLCVSGDQLSSSSLSTQLYFYQTIAKYLNSQQL